MTTMYRAANNFRRKVTRFYSRIVRKEFEKEVSMLITDKESINTFFTSLEKYDFNPRHLIMTCFPVGKLEEGKKLLNSIQNRGIEFALNEISLEEKRLILTAMNTPDFSEIMNNLSDSLLPEKVI
ncbi:g120 [Yersinia phage phiR1-37]|uniref:hypothetical protein n=1 Tax=Yersinia phage phiR1-37 TaxID=331278 RepID=UPI00022DBD24|nr:hypothetical protein phiR1-37_gp120 [Yersinia phage phiR1-37]CCE26144.1 g120 [Yersinia phage phiR1-37]